MCPIPYVMVEVMRRSSITGKNGSPHIQSGKEHVTNIGWPNLYIIDVVHKDP